MLKRSFDLIVAVFLLLLTFPVIVIVYILVCVFLGRPAIFSQLRPGLHGKPFRVLKFRTMSEAKNSDGELLSDAERLTHFGSFLRKTSLDELPQLLNVITGDISLVGPRPLLMEYLALYTEEQMKRHNVRPGITGWAQINGRNAISWEEKFKMDIWYVDNHSFWLDIKILFLTLKKVIKKEGITARGEVTMPRFEGNRIGVKK